MLWATMEIFDTPALRAMVSMKMRRSASAISVLSRA